MAEVPPAEALERPPVDLSLSPGPRPGRAVAGRSRERKRHTREPFARAIEYVPYWVVVGVALALGVGTTIGYKRIVVTVAEKIGKAHLTYAQGAAAEVVAAVTIGLADVSHMPVSTTHVLSSGVAGTMWANRSGLQARDDSENRPGLGVDSSRRHSAGGHVIRRRRPADPRRRTVARTTASRCR